MVHSKSVRSAPGDDLLTSRAEEDKDVRCLEFLNAVQVVAWEFRDHIVRRDLNLDYRFQVALGAAFDTCDLLNFMDADRSAAGERQISRPHITFPPADRQVRGFDQGLTVADVRAADDQGGFCEADVALAAFAGAGASVGLQQAGPNRSFDPAARCA